MIEMRLMLVLGIGIDGHCPTQTSYLREATHLHPPIQPYHFLTRPHSQDHLLQQTGLY